MSEVTTTKTAQSTTSRQEGNDVTRRGCEYTWELRLPDLAQGIAYKTLGGLKTGGRESAGV